MRDDDLIAEGLEYFERAGDEGDAVYTAAIRKELSRLTTELAARDQALAEARRDGVDAQRYRWLISRINYQDGTDGCAWAHLEWCVGLSGRAPADLDAAIDAAIAQEKGNG